MVTKKKFFRVIGNNEEYSYEKRFLTTSCLTISVFLAILCAVHILMHLKSAPVYFAGSSSVVFLCLYFLIRFHSLILLPKLFLTIWSVLFLDFTWYTKFQSFGPVLLFIFALGALIVWVWDGKTMVIMLAAYFLNIALLFYIEYTSPNFSFTTNYSNISIRSIDIYLSFTLYSILMIFLLLTIKKDFNRQKEKAIGSDRLKSAFLANMSHEIRTPLNSIIGFSQLLNEEMDSKKREKFISIIRNSGESLIKLISDLIDLSKIEAGDFNLNYSSLSIKELFIEIQDIYSIELLKREKKEIKMHYNLPQADILAFSDGYRIKQVLMNLLNNAIKFTEKGEIIFSCEKKGDELLFIVSDTGTGIPDEDQKKIFERFTKFNYQGMNMEGTGIGLSIVEKLIAILKGRIWLKSELGKGTSFYFAVPFIHSKSKTPLNRITIEKKNAVDLANKNVILIVEDDEESYLLIKEILRPMNLEIHIVNNGEDAISFLKITPQIRLILMDIKLPYMSGYETARIIKKINPDIPIIAQTAYAMVGDKERAFEAGCKEYITKPLNPDKLRFLVNEYILRN